MLFITGYAESAVLGEGRLEAGMQVMTELSSMDALTTCIRQLIPPR
ncbi:hypothetical protein [Teichococcus vastitatis]|uniref:Uncharacterized protein n=1 Tax=Teichococcus vastitatis TaxID=2307076 RepID=A0ABS9W8M3_9PROT|nr:hypothetical protein [Pseudoroseomonas vastitatis]MCI0755363.1 hypothetical protein [Pseudoroseomonas vastitatis]